VVRGPLALVAAVAAFAAAAPAAPAAIPFGRCAGEDLFDALSPARRCARIRVPLDHSGRVAGGLPLYLERVRASRRRRSAVFALAGGPGQAATPFTADFAALLAPALRSRDLVVLDQRGTGRSGVLRCPSLERSNFIDPARSAPEACARRLGARRAFYTTRDSVADLELVRRRLRLRRIVLYGISYGTKVALAYALEHPDRVERLVLDSALEPEGPDPFYRDSLKALPRALGQLCSRRCPGGADAARDLDALAGRLQRRALRGYVVGSDGRRRRASLTGVDLFVLMLAGDLEPELRAGVPAGVRSALRGDPLPLIRLARRARRAEGEPPPPREMSVGLYAATTCAETYLPWARAASPDERRRQAEAAVRAVPEADLHPFGPSVALASDLIALCLRWPQGAEPAPPATGALPSVPALILSGDQDLRTPREGALRLQSRLPGARLVTVRDSGHSVLGSDFTGCAVRALREFFANRRVPARCGRRLGVFEPAAYVPSSLREVPPAGGVGGRRGRTLAAVRLTLSDVLGSVSRSARGGGLRGGAYRARVRGVERLRESDLRDASEEELDELFEELVRTVYLEIRLDRVEVVRGVRVSGTLRLGTERARGTVRVSGGTASGGRLRVAGRRGRIVLSGRLSGRPVRAAGELGGADAWAARAAAGELGGADAWAARAAAASRASLGAFSR
jgi:pimeloyl-ACP methyl ester carboxylesterase